MGSLTLLIYLAIFVAVLLLLNVLYLSVFGRSIKLDRQMNRRLDLLSRGGQREEVLEQLRKETTQHRAMRGVPLYARLAEKAQKANIAFSPKALMAVMGLACLFAFTGLTVATQTGLILRVILALGMGVGGVWLWVSQRAAKRIAMAEEQLPDAVELIVRALRVGHPFVSAIQSVARELPDPLGTEFGIVADESSYGRNISDSLRDLAERMYMQDLRFLAVAVSIQQSSGGNLAEVLEGLSKVIRARFRLMRRVSAITAEPRWSGIFLSAFPLVILAIIQIIAPDFYDGVKDTPAFMPTVIVVFVLLGANVLFMKIMTTIRV